MKQHSNKRARLVGAGIAGTAVLGGLALWFTGGEAPVPPPPPMAPVVEYVEARVLDQRATIAGFGRVEAVDRIALAPQVAGCVERVAEGLAAGARVRRGELLLALDPRDYRIAVTRAESELRGAEARLREEQGRQAIAAGEWALLPEAVRAATPDPSLVRREPQRLAAEAQLRAAQGALEEAELNLARTELRAPFDAVVLAEDVAPGRQVAAGDGLVTLASAAGWTVDLATPEAIADLAETTAGTPVALRRSVGDDTPVHGEVVALLGEVDNRDRQARIRVAIRAAGPAARLRIGAEVVASVPTKMLHEVVQLPAEAVHAGDEIWVLGADDRLEIRTATVVLRSGGEAYVRGGGLRSGDRVVVGNLAVPLAGMRLQGVART